jgi:hypothetical protein
MNIDLSYDNLTLTKLKTKKLYKIISCKYLNLSGNYLEIIDGKYLPPYLNKLNISNCNCSKIINLPINLEILHASNNYLQEIIITSSFREVRLKNNLITKIVFDNNCVIEKLVLCINHLYTLPPLPLSLIHLEISYNHLLKYPYLMDSNIQYLKINNNIVYFKGNKLYHSLIKYLIKSKYYLYVKQYVKSKINIIDIIQIMKIIKKIQILNDIKIENKYSKLLHILNQIELDETSTIVYS